MDYHVLLDLVTGLGYRLGICGAETYRIEESVNRIMKAYGIPAEAFAIPNCLHVSIETADGKPLTRMRRIPHHGNDMDSVEKYSNLSRRICAETPDPHIAMQWLTDTDKSLRSYTLPVYLLGNFLGACGFSILFGGSLTDALWSGLCGLLIGIVNHCMERLNANNFFKIITSAFLAGCLAHTINTLGLCANTDGIIIGALMILVPGWLFTNALRDIIYGDTNSGINRIVQVFLIAVAIALGTAAAWNLVSSITASPTSATVFAHPLWFEAIACFFACCGFSILFNIHGPGGLLCAAGGTLAWFCYRISLAIGCGDILAYLLSTALVALYSEVMARVRKYPAISYLVVSLFPLIPGAGIYYAMCFAVRGEMTSFVDKLGHTAAIAGSMAVGILIVSTCFKLLSSRLIRK